MASTDLRFPVQRAMQNITMNVTLTGLRVWKARLTLGVWIIKLAALVMGVGIHVDMERVEGERRDRRGTLVRDKC